MLGASLLFLALPCSMRVHFHTERLLDASLMSIDRVCGPLHSNLSYTEPMNPTDAAFPDLYKHTQGSGICINILYRAFGSVYLARISSTSPPPLHTSLRERTLEKLPVMGKPSLFHPCRPVLHNRSLFSPLVQMKLINRRLDLLDCGSNYSRKDGRSFLPSIDVCTVNKHRYRAAV